uniref:OmpH family outer membrane protein n=1 Tax=candidate division WOR-3 bacterium TaxID=2052148 RepID=A0A7C4XNK8_UNCW3
MKINFSLSFLILFLPLMVLAKEQKIGFVESNRIFNEYQATASANAQFNEFVVNCRDSAASLQQGIANLKQELEAQKLLLSEEARLKKLDEIENLTKIYNQYLQEVFGPGGKIEQKNDELMAPLLKKINDAVAKIASQEGFSMVIDLSEGIFYASPELNITDLVISELNREYGTTAQPQEATKKYIGILPLREENSEAANAKLGEQSQDILYNGLSTFSQLFKIIEKNTIRSEFYNRSWNTTMEIDDKQIFQLGHKLLCNYLITGRIKKVAVKIEYTLILKDVDRETEVTRRTNSVTDEIRLSEALNNDLRSILDEIKKKE